MLNDNKIFLIWYPVGQEWVVPTTNLGAPNNGSFLHLVLVLKHHFGVKPIDAEKFTATNKFISQKSIFSFFHNISLKIFVVYGDVI